MPRFQRRLGRRLMPILLSVGLLTLLYYTWVLRGARSPHSPFALSPFSSFGTGPGRDQTAPIAHVPSSVDWARIKPKHPVTELTPLPAGVPRDLPRVQFDFGTAATTDDEGHRRDREKNRARSEAVKRLFLKGWTSYADRAFGMDELGPVSGRGKTTFGGWAATLVDALDTLWIMGLRDEFRRAARLACAIDFGKSPSTAANVFETTIRHLGGLLAAYDLSGGAEPALLAKATELGNLLYAAFDTPNRMPVFWLRLEDVRARNGPRLLAGTREPSAAAASLGVELTRLSQLTGDDKFFDAAERVKRVLAAWQARNETWIPGLWPVYVNWRDGSARDKKFGIGAEADSLYEYLPKMFALLGGVDEAYADMTTAALDAARDHLLFRPMTPGEDDILFPGDVSVQTREERVASTRLEPQVQHLGCFAGGMYALAGRLLLRPEYVDVGAKLALGCAWAYEAMPSGIMPEVSTVHPCAARTERTYDDEKQKQRPLSGSRGAAAAGEVDLLAGCSWDQDRWNGGSDRKLPLGFQRVRDKRYLLRPEAIESMFYLWRITGRAEYRERAWAMFEAVEAATGAKYGSGSVESVLVGGGRGGVLDMMESFWFSETLKYFYLIFSPPEHVSLDDWVFNTEAHPLKRPKRSA